MRSYSVMMLYEWSEVFEELRRVLRFLGSDVKSLRLTSDEAQPPVFGFNGDIVIICASEFMKGRMLGIYEGLLSSCSAELAVISVRRGCVDDLDMLISEPRSFKIKLVENSLMTVDNTLDMLRALGYDLPDLRELRAKASRFVDECSFPEELGGRDMLRDCIIYAMAADTEHMNMSVELYPAVSRYYEMNASTIDRIVRRLLSTGWESIPMELREKVFGKKYAAGKPVTNKKFISAAAEYLLNVSLPPFADVVAPDFGDLL